MSTREWNYSDVLSRVDWTYEYLSRHPACSFTGASVRKAVFATAMKLPLLFPRSVAQSSLCRGSR